VAYAGISFKDQVKTVGLNIKRLGTEISSLRQAFEQEKAVFMQPVLDEKLQTLSDFEASAKQAEAEISSLESGLGKAGLEKAKLESGLEAIRQGPEFKSISSLNERKALLLRKKQAAKTELVEIFAKVEKPLHRLEKAAKARKLFLPEKQAMLLSELLASPFRALKLDPKAESLKLVLLEAKKAIESGLIELKPREHEKKLAVLQELLSFDFFAEIFWKFNRLDSELLAIEKRLSEMPAKAQESNQLSLLERARKDEGRAMEQLSLKKASLERARSGAKTVHLEIQNLLSEATGKTVVLMA